MGVSTYYSIRSTSTIIKLNFILKFFEEPTALVVKRQADMNALSYFLQHRTSGVYLTSRHRMNTVACG